jgi:hypothetical protein
MSLVPSKTFRENDELVSDLARFSEGILTEKQVRKKWHLLDESAWVAIGEDDLMVEMVEAEQVRRIRNGAAKREKAQNFVTSAPDVLNGIMSDPKANARHRIDSAKALDDLAGFAPQRPGVEQDRVVIRIDLSADTKDPADVLTFEAVARPQSNNDAKIVDGTPQERAPMIAASEQFDQDVIPVKRGPGRPKGSRNKPKAIDEDEPSVRGVPGFDVSGD